MNVSSQKPTANEVSANQHAVKFVDDLVKNDESGGQEAAQLLRKSVSDYLKKQFPELQHDLDLVIRVYANFKRIE